MIAEHAVERADHCGAPGPLGCSRRQRHQRRERSIDGAAHKAHHPTHAPVNEPGESLGRLECGSPEDPWSSGDVVVHRLDHLGHKNREIDGKATGAAQIRER